jgi:hypothetical protein
LHGEQGAVNIALGRLWIVDLLKMSINSPEYYWLLVEQRGWKPEALEQWLSEAWCRLLLKKVE